VLWRKSEKALGGMDFIQNGCLMTSRGASGKI